MSTARSQKATKLSLTLQLMKMKLKAKTKKILKDKRQAF
jgi:hypothetical protein